MFLIYLAIVFVPSIEARWHVENEDVAVLETKAGPSVRDRQLLVRIRNFLHISLQIND